MTYRTRAYAPEAPPPFQNKNKTKPFIIITSRLKYIRRLDKNLMHACRILTSLQEMK